MQSVLVYGRLLARALATGINNEFHQQLTWKDNSPQGTLASHARSFHLVTASSGFSKSQAAPQLAQVSKTWSFGDDAFFVANHKSGDVLGVADGVGGWRNYGVDPSLFPCSLMATCQRLVKLGRFCPQNPVDILSSSYTEVLQDKQSLIGSCTACVVALHRQEKKVYTANLGDSGYLLIRQGHVIERSEEQQHYFNTPFQLAVAPTVLEGVVLSDSPESAQSHSFGVEEGDIILMGTDGLFDNMNEEMILYHVKKLKGHGEEHLQMIANKIAYQAHQLAFDPEYLSPFSINAAANGFQVTGGKPDDVTVLLACVTEQPIT